MYNCWMMGLKVGLWAFTIEQLELVIFMSIALFLTVLSDVIFIALTRLVLRWAVGMDSFIKIVGVFLLNCLAGLIFVVMPFVASEALLPTRDSTYLDKDVILVTWPNSLIRITYETLNHLGPMNVTVLMPALAFAITALCLICNRYVIWPVLQRPIYALARTGILKHKAILAAAGVALISLSHPAVGKWIEPILKLLM